MTDVLGGATPPPPTQQQAGAPAVVVVPQAVPPAPQIPEGMMRREEVMALIEKTRQEEKDKLYPEIERLTTEMKTLTDDRQAAVEAKAEADRIAAEQAEAQRRAEQTALERLTEAETRWESELRQMREAAERAEILRQKEMEYSQLQAYKAQRIGQMQGEIDPRFIDYVTGNSMEEIELSLAVAAAKTNEMAAEIQEAMGGRRRELPLPVSGTPGSITPEQLSGQGQTRELSNEDLRNLDPGDYAAMRSQLMRASSDAVARHGLYGTA